MPLFLHMPYFIHCDYIPFYVRHTPSFPSPYVSAVVSNSILLLRTHTNLHTCHTAHSCDLVLPVLS